MKPLLSLDFSSANFDPTNNLIRDCSGNGRHFTKTGTTKLAKRGVAFNGTSDYLGCSDTTLTNGSSNMTICMVINPITLSGFMTFISKWDFQTQGQWWWQNNGTSIAFLVATTLADGGNTYAVGSKALVAGAVQSIVWVYDGALAAANRMKLYYNGILDSGLTIVGTIPTALLSATSTIKIGRVGGILTRYANANIYDCRVYNQSFTQIQANLYHQQALRQLNMV